MYGWKMEMINDSSLHFFPFLNQFLITNFSSPATRVDVGVEIIAVDTETAAAATGGGRDVLDVVDVTNSFPDGIIILSMCADFSNIRNRASDIEK